MMRSIMRDRDRITVSDQERVRHPIIDVFNAGIKSVNWPKPKKEDSLKLDIVPQDEIIRIGSVILFNVRVPAANLGTIEAEVTSCEPPSLLVIEGKSNIAELMTRFELNEVENGQETDVTYHFDAKIRNRLIRCIAKPAIEAAFNTQLPRVVAEYIDNVSSHINTTKGLAT